MSIAEMRIGAWCRDSSARRAVEKTQLKQIGLVYIHDCIGFFADGGGNRLQADGPAAEFVDNRMHHPAVDVVQAQLVNLQQVQRLASDLRRNYSSGADLRIIPDSAQQAERHARRAARPLS